MTLRHAFIGLALCAMALTLLACVEPAPLSPPQGVEAPPPSPEPPIYFVNVSSLALRDGPTTSAPQISTLGFNEEVELLDTSGGWARVRDLNRGLIGWASMRYLQPAPASTPRRAPSRRPAPPKEEAPKPPEAPTPKAM
jgi:hypothetical protein